MKAKIELSREPLKLAQTKQDIKAAEEFWKTIKSNGKRIQESLFEVYNEQMFSRTKSKK